MHALFPTLRLLTHCTPLSLTHYCAVCEVYRTYMHVVMYISYKAIALAM